MSRKEGKIPVADLQKYIARGVLVAPDINPKTKKVSITEVAYTLRPSWSNVGKYVPALPGGKIKPVDFQDVPKEAFDDPYFILTLDQVIEASLQATIREIQEELNIPLLTSMLSVMDISKNKAGWNTLAHGAQLPDKPTLIVRPNSAGTMWIDTQKIKNGQPRLLSGHLGITRRVLENMK